jgi:prepilin-type N-terminal cleavage/methylation domain-containing protein
MTARQAHAGFSLVEVLCAILILGVALVALTQGITAALGSGRESELQTTAALLASGRIEALRAEWYLKDGETEGDCGGSLAGCRWRQSVTPGPLPGLHEVSVAIEDARSGQAIYGLRTLLFEPPEEPPASAQPGAREARP